MQIKFLSLALKSALIASFSILSLSCSLDSLTNNENEHSNVSLNITLQLTPVDSASLGKPAEAAVIARVLVSVNGPDMNAIATELTRDGNQFRGSIDVPKGKDRTFKVFAKNLLGIDVYEGSKTLNIEEDELDVFLSVNRIAADVTINSSYVDPSIVDEAILKVTGPNMPELNVNLNIEDNQLQGRIDVPKGNNRLFYVLGKNELGLNLYVGEKSVDIQQNEMIVRLNLLPFKPKGLDVSRDLEDRIHLEWDAVDGAERYTVFRDSLQDGNYPVISAPSGTSWDDHDVRQARWYHYAIAAVAGDEATAPSRVVSGYRMGWRFDNTRPYADSDGFGSLFDLYAFGFKDQTRAVAIYAIYQDNNGNLDYVPGSGEFGFAAATGSRKPGFSETVFEDDEAFLAYDLWSSDWQNDNFQQYIVVDVFKSANISSLGDPSYDFFLFSITWGSSSTEGQPVAQIQSPQQAGTIESVKKQFLATHKRNNR